MARAGGDPHRRAPGYSAKWLKKTAVMVMMMMVMVMMMTTMMMMPMMLMTMIMTT